MSKFIKRVILATLAVASNQHFVGAQLADNSPQQVSDDLDPTHPDHPDHLSDHNHKPSHVPPEYRRKGRRRKRRPKNFDHLKGDGSKPSHAYDYIHEEVHHLNMELADTEDTFGHESDEVQEILSKVRLLEQIQRNARMLDDGMPQEEFDEFVGWLTRLSELQLWDHINGPGSLRKRREKEEHEAIHGTDPESENHYDEHDEEYEEAKQANSKEMMTLNEQIRETEDDWRHVPRPMTHDATKEQRLEIMDLYKKLRAVSNRDDRKVIRAQMEHLQSVIHDNRRHKDMTDEDREEIKTLRQEMLVAETEEEKREIQEEIEDIYREHRKGIRLAEERAMKKRRKPIRKNHHATDDQLKDLHAELDAEEDRDERMNIRQKIRDRLQWLRENEKATSVGQEN